MQNKNNNSPNGFPIIKEILLSVAKYAPNKGETTTQELPLLSVEKFIPRTDYYSYTPSTDEQCIVFSLENGIFVDEDCVEMLKKLIKANVPSSNKPDFPIYISKFEATYTRQATNNEIYIDCQPTGSSEEEVDVSNRKSTNSSTFSTKEYLTTLYMIAGFIAIIVILFGIHFAINQIAKS